MEKPLTGSDLGGTTDNLILHTSHAEPASGGEIPSWSAADKARPLHCRTKRSGNKSERSTWVRERANVPTCAQSARQQNLSFTAVLGSCNATQIASLLVTLDGSEGTHSRPLLGHLRGGLCAVPGVSHCRRAVRYRAQTKLCRSPPPKVPQHTGALQGYKSKRDGAP
jgi:hypothetical protein